MASLVVALTKSRAKEDFDRRGFNQEAGDDFIGQGEPSYGNRYDEIIMIDPLVLDNRSWEWLTRGLMTRMHPAGEFAWELQ